MGWKALSRAAPARLRIGVSSCLLGERVRYDGGHKEDPFLTRVLSRWVEWVPVCPELEVGLGVPREAMRLEGSMGAPHLVTIETRIDHTRAMERFSRRRVRELAELELDGYIFKSRSPSCGPGGVTVVPRAGGGGSRAAAPPAPRVRHAAGLFAREFMARFPFVPVEDESRLSRPAARGDFIARVLVHRRWKQLLEAGVSRERLAAFHAAHRPLLRAHSPKGERELRSILAAPRLRPSAMASRYGELFAAALRMRPSRRQASRRQASRRQASRR